MPRRLARGKQPPHPRPGFWIERRLMILTTKGFRLIFPVLAILLIALPAATADAVIFANDSLYLYSGGTRIADQSVLVAPPGPGEGDLTVCVEGAYWLRQGPTWKAGPYTFIRTRGDNLTFAQWLKTPEGQAGRDQGGPESQKVYQAYLRMQAANPCQRVSITLPTVKKSPALEKTASPPPRPGMTGGMIGNHRFFRIDLDTGTVTQVPREPVRRTKEAPGPDGSPRPAR